MSDAREATLRRRIVETCRRMNAVGINQGTSGNVSARLDGDRFVVTPSGASYGTLRTHDLVVMTVGGAASGSLRPSSEWRIHRDVYAARPEVGAVLHAHPIRTTALACHGRGLPSFHYMVAVAGGNDIRCAPYATFGSAELAEGAVRALEGRKACLLAHHGLVTLGDDPDMALDLAVEVETLAAMYLEALRIGEPPTLSGEEMVRVKAAFTGYGRWSGPGTP